MLHIIGVILKILGITLLVLIGLLLLILLSVLFAPICYSGEGKKAGNVLCGKVTVHWFFHLIHVRIEYMNKKMDKEVYILGIPLFATKKWVDQHKEKKQKSEDAHKEKKTEVIDDKVLEHTISEDSKKPEAEKIENQTESKPEGIRAQDKMKPENGKDQTETKTEEKDKKDKKSKKSIIVRIKEKKDKIVKSVRNIAHNIKQKKDFLMMEDTKAALKNLWAALKKILKHVFPVKMQGNLTFGFDDPAKTGYVLALAGSFYPLYCNKFQLRPVFSQAVLEGNIKFRGRIVIGYLALQGFLLYRNKEIKRTYDRFRHKEEA